MDVLKAIIMGLTQGLTEFIPVSSSGHLILVGNLLNFDGGLAFDVALNVGTLAALLAFFWKDFIKLAGSFTKKGPDTKLAWFLVLATIPGVIGGVLLETQAETVFRSTNIVAFNLIIIALVMLVADRWGKRIDGLDKMNAPKALGIGVAQALALVPGVSRSGITISAGLAQGFDRVSATRFSFLLSAPIIAGASLKVLAKPSNLELVGAQPVLVMIGILASFISGYWAIKFMLRYLSKHSLSVFAYYRLAVGLVFLLTGVGN